LFNSVKLSLINKFRFSSSRHYQFQLHRFFRLISNYYFILKAPTNSQSIITTKWIIIFVSVLTDSLLRIHLVMASNDYSGQPSYWNIRLRFVTNTNYRVTNSLVERRVSLMSWAQRKTKIQNLFKHWEDYSCDALCLIRIRFFEAEILICRVYYKNLCHLLFENIITFFTKEAKVKK